MSELWSLVNYVRQHSAGTFRAQQARRHRHRPAGSIEVIDEKDWASLHRYSVARTVARRAFTRSPDDPSPGGRGPLASRAPMSSSRLIAAIRAARSPTMRGCRRGA